MQNENNTKDREIIVSRIVNAPRELVWKVWTNPEHLDKWWGPNGFNNETHSMEFKVGGSWRYTMHSAEQGNFDNKVVYEKIEEPSMLVYTLSDDKEVPDIKFSVTVTFEDYDGKTKVTQHSVFPNAEVLRKVVEEFGALEGAKQHFNNMELYVAMVQGFKSLVYTREYDAPRQLVWDALTQAEHLKHWWGPVGLEMKHTTVDLRVGGLFHYGMATPDGNEMWGRFMYNEIEEPNKLVFTSSFSNAQGEIAPPPFPGLVFPAEIRNTVTLQERDGKTIMTWSGQPVNATDEEVKTFEGLIGSMQQGFGGTFEQLHNYLNKI